MFLAECLSFFRQQTKALLLLVFLHSLIINRNHLCSNYPFASTQSITHSSLAKMRLDGQISFKNMEFAAKDFGNRYHLMPSAVLYPKSVSDVSSVVKHVYDLGLTSELTVAARGHGHSLQGQAQAFQGIVISMESLRVTEMRFQTKGLRPFVDVCGGELWIDVLHESLKHGLAPRSWTDYLHLTVGGTLSNAGISGQAFKHGPQISNVYQLQVVTGRGEVVTCSEEENVDLFHAVLGGLGQFGIITQARIALEPAPKMVKWIRTLYADFSTFARDQEHLIASTDSFDYVEGFVIINRSGLLNWRSSFNTKDPVQADQFTSEGKLLFCLEVGKYYNPQDLDQVDHKIDTLLSELNFIRSTLFLSEVSYVEFLDRVHVSEVKLREKGLWDVPHPWLNLLVPRSKIDEFAIEVFGNIVNNTSNGPVLIYPVNNARWKSGTSLITPEEDVFYLVAFLSSAMPSSTGKDGLDHILSQNKKILDFVERPYLGIKQYLPHYSNEEDWKAHFGAHWEVFCRRKLSYDPLAILAPGQRIFRREKAFALQ